LVHFKLYSSVDELPKEWNVIPTDDIFLKTGFLSALEKSSPSNIRSFYVGVFSSETLVGIAVLQRVELYAEDIFRNAQRHWLKNLGKDLVSAIAKGNAIIVGNLMHTGQHGFSFASEAISQEAFLDSIVAAIAQLSSQIKTQIGKKIRVVAFKDYFENDPIHSSAALFQSQNLYKVQMQPNMMLSIAPEWTSPPDYVLAFNKKYRRRYTTARKKLNPFTARELSLEQIKTHQETIYDLYESVSDNAGVNSFKLHPHHFYELKSHLNESFKLFGYFKDEQLVGFYTLILNGIHLETYFLGYHQQLQHEHHMYLNMLYDMAFFGITQQFKTVIFARTAMEIKSSIGAKPHVMDVYLKHTHTFFANRILKLIVKYMNPVKDWEERHPF